ncbi:hypothetical protein ACFZB9_34950 [Kitasatospora sp. NPDC008050]|uniref:COG4705 family protein n=1 Tax=Kitasatospora sp. NPDC008050 TaxID=3364021 RepID=UPI0036EBD190
MTTTHPHVSSPPGAGLRVMNKVPEATATFWTIKVLTTGMGETASDFLAHLLNPIIAVGIGGLGLLICLALQFTVRRYIAAVYWAAVVMVSVFGTMAADTLHVALHVPYAASAPAFLIALVAIFATWYRTEGTLSIRSIRTRRQEAFYWATVLATFALGTAVGDLTATTFGWGYLSSGIAFAVLIALPALAHRLVGLGAVPAFWIAYVLTRPLGASFADWMAVSHERGGLDLGLGPVTLGWTVAILALVAFVAARRGEARD